MRLAVTGVETIEITDPKGLIEAQAPGPLEALQKAGIQPTRPLPDLTKLRPTGPKPQPTIPAVPSSPYPGGPYTTPFSPKTRPYTTGDPLVNPIPLPGHTPAERPQLPRAQWTHLTGANDRWRCGLRAAAGDVGRQILHGQKNRTEQVF